MRSVTSSARAASGHGRTRCREVLAALRPGDVIFVPRARRRGLAVVLSVRDGRPDRPRAGPEVLPPLGRDFQDPPAVLTKVPLPRSGSVRSARYRRDLAASSSPWTSVNLARREAGRTHGPSARPRGTSAWPRHTRATSVPTARARAMGDQGLADRAADPRSRAADPNPHRDPRAAVRPRPGGPRGAGLRARVRDHAEGAHPGTDLRRGRHADVRGARGGCARRPRAVGGGRRGLDVVYESRERSPRPSEMPDAGVGRAVPAVPGDLARTSARPRIGTRSSSAGSSRTGSRPRSTGGREGESLEDVLRETGMSPGRLRPHLQAGARPAPPDRGRRPGGGLGRGPAGAGGGQPRRRRVHRRVTERVATARLPEVGCPRCRAPSASSR